MIRSSGITTEQTNRYDLLMSTSGNRPLFGEDVYGVSTGDYISYEIPGEALTDERFANMMRKSEGSGCLCV